MFNLLGVCWTDFNSQVAVVNSFKGIKIVFFSRALLIAIKGS